MSLLSSDAAKKFMMYIKRTSFRSQKKKELAFAIQIKILSILHPVGRISKERFEKHG
jgi:hypothetical protein